MESEKTTNYMAPKIDQCFRSNGCKVPYRPSQPSTPQKQKDQCHVQLNQVLKTNIQNCVRRSSPGFSFPPEQATSSHPPKRQPLTNRKTIETACGGSQTKAKSVQDCIKKQRADSNQADKDRKDRFDRNCQAKKQCEFSLDSSCRLQLTNEKKIICQCNQQERTEQKITAARASISACSSTSSTSSSSSIHGSGAHHPQKKPTKKGGMQKLRSCDADQEKDWCVEGYEAWKKHQMQAKNAQ
jgi:hypothetical protein